MLFDSENSYLNSANYYLNLKFYFEYWKLLFESKFDICIWEKKMELKTWYFHFENHYLNLEIVISILRIVNWNQKLLFEFEILYLNSLKNVNSKSFIWIWNYIFPIWKFLFESN